MKQVEAHRLANNWEYVQKVWKNEKTKHNLHNWSLERMNTDDKAGLCSYSNQTIYISSIFMMGHNCNYAKVKKVLMHEIAHALTPGHSHEKQWKDKCQELGGEDRLGITMVMNGRNWAVTCSYCKWRQEYLSRPKIDGMLCGKCRTPIKIKYII